MFCKYQNMICEQIHNNMGAQTRSQVYVFLKNIDDNSR
jgi:hypothetical protein